MDKFPLGHAVKNKTKNYNKGFALHAFGYAGRRQRKGCKNTVQVDVRDIVEPRDLSGLGRSDAVASLKGANDAGAL